MIIWQQFDANLIIMGSNLKRQQIKQIPWIILFGFQHCESFKFLVVKINWNFLQCFRVEHPSPSEQQFYRMHCFVLIRIRFDDQSDQNQIRSEWSESDSIRVIKTFLDVTISVMSLFDTMLFNTALSPQAPAG